MTRPYELVYIFDSAMDEAQIQEHLERFHALITTPENPEPVSASAHWGKRTLAYPLDRRDVGYYVVEQFDAPAEVLPELERAIKLDDAVLRYLLVVNEGYAPIGAQEDATEADERSNDSEEEDE